MNDYPADWNEPVTLRGFAKVAFSRRYDVKLSVLGTQYRFAQATSQREAATLYDLALWKLAAFITRKLKPNFPDAFDSITQADVDELCPALNELYKKVEALDATETDEDEQTRRKAALAKHAAPTVTPAECLAGYTRFCKRLEQARNATVLNGFRLRQARQDVNFVKLPEVARLANLLEGKLDELHTVASELASSLKSHEAYYAKLQNP